MNRSPAERAHVGVAGRERGRPPGREVAVPGQVRRQRPIASRQRAPHRLPAPPRMREPVEQDEVGGHRAGNHDSGRHLREPARVRGRARPLRPARGVHVAGLALHPARPLARARRAAAAGHLAPRRALRRLLRARPGQGERPPGRARLHLGHRRGQLRARGDRGARGARAADRAHRRPAARAARRRRRADDRPGQALRQRGQVVRGDRRPARDARARALAPRPRLPRLLDGARRPPRARPPQRRPARAARRGRAAARGRARRRRPRRRPAVGQPPRPAGGAARRARSTASPPSSSSGRARCSSPGRLERDPQLGHGAGGLRGPRRRAAAGRADLRRPPRAGRRRPLRRAAARPGVGRRARAGAGAAGRRPADVQAAAPVARRRCRRTRCRSRSTPRPRGRTPRAPWRR